MASSGRPLARLLAWQPARFILVGLSNTALSYAVFALLMASLPPGGLRVPVAQAASYAAGMAWSFLWNRHWTFRAGGRPGLAGQGLRFVVTQVGCLLLSVVLVSVALQGLGLPQPVGWLAAMAVVTGVNYLATARWVFRASG